MTVAARSRGALLLGLAAVLVAAWSAAFGDAADRDSARGDALSPLERWERLDEEQRERLRERYQRYRSMTAAERGELAERARILEATQRRVLARLSDEEHARLLSLEDERRRAILDELVEDELKVQGRRLYAKLPAEWRERFEQSDPEQRLRAFTEFKEKTRERMSRRALDVLGAHLGLDQDELRAMKRLPEQERLMKVLELQKLLQARSVEENGLPAGLTPERWSEMLKLEPEDFFVEVMTLRESAGWREQRVTSEEGPGSAQARKRSAARAILGELRPRPAERLELAHLSPAERRAEVAARRRARVLGVLSAHGVFDAAELDELAALPDGELFARVRRLVDETGVLEERAAPAIGDR